MKKIQFLLIISFLVLISFSYAKAEKKIEEEKFGWLNRIDSIKIYVESAQMVAEENEWEKKIYSVATSAKRYVGNIYFEKEGWIWKIVFNPFWFPPENIRKDYASKGKKLPRAVPPGKDNPLGPIKLFFAFDGHNSSLGLHGTNKPDSIGKRVTYACTRGNTSDMFEIARIILEQNGYDAGEIFKQARKNPQKTITIPLEDMPKVVHKKGLP